MSVRIRQGVGALMLLMMAAMAAAATHEVRDDASFAAALRGAKAGDVIRIAPGTYRGGLWMEASGTQEAPIVIEGSDQTRPPVIEGGGNAIQVSGASYVTLRNFRVRGQTGNGLNLDDGGRRDGQSRGLVLENLHVSDIGPRGNHDGIKLSGLSDFVVRNCTVEGWGGSAIDMVGCHDGTIEDSSFRGKDGFDQSSGIQAKGGSANITIRRCDFVDAGQRAINCGGSTGLQFFRPADATAEAKDIAIEHCRFVGSEAAVAFVGVDGARFERNTIYHPRKWIFRILQETRGEPFVPCRNVKIERNMIIWQAGQVRTHINIGPHTAPDTFRFVGNHWYCTDAPARSRPQLPTEERGAIHGKDPQVQMIGDLPVTRLNDIGAQRE